MVVVVVGLVLVFYRPTREWSTHMKGGYKDQCDTAAAVHKKTPSGVPLPDIVCIY